MAKQWNNARVVGSGARWRGARQVSELNRSGFILHADEVTGLYATTYESMPVRSYELINEQLV